MPVEKGNKIYISADDIIAKEVTIKWSQNFSDRSQQYYVCVFLNKDQGDDKSLILIQKSMLDQFKSRSADSGYNIIVDESFQYGQKEGNGSDRWLVFHDKSQKLFQWRFMDSTTSKYGEWVGKNFGSKFPSDIVARMRMVGNYLKDF